MAIKSGQMLSGTLGSYVLRKVANKQVVSRKLRPGEMKQTKATKREAKTFGLASKLGKQIRLTVKNELEKLYDPAMSIRMTKTLKEILISCRDDISKSYSFEAYSFSGLNNFDYNLKSPLNKNLKINLTPTMADGILRIVIPEIKADDLMKFLSGSSGCQLTIGISLFRLSEGLKVFKEETQSMLIPKNASSLPMQEFDFKIPDGCLCVVNVFLKYFSTFNDLTTVLNSKTFNPAGIITTLITPGPYAGGDGRSWKRMPGLKFKQKKQI